ncbi:MAG: hypothetical protein ACKVOQ_23550 [Cyclobacteriaceae bacterium]
MKNSCAKVASEVVWSEPDQQTGRDSSGKPRWRFASGLETDSPVAHAPRRASPPK